MAARPIRLFGDPVLRAPCRPVTQFDEGLARLVADLIDTCRLPGRAGVAAPQIGVSRRVFSYNVDGREGYVVNPILVHTDRLEEDEEACLSLPDVHAPTPRAWSATVTGVDVRGDPVEVQGTGLLARCLQHETDHLDVRLFIDHLDRPARGRILGELRRLRIAEDGSRSVFP